MWSQDIRYSLRTFARNPGFTAITVLTLALGIGANTAIFTLINSLLLRALPAPDPQQLVQISAVTRTGGTTPLSHVMFNELQRRQRVFSAVFAASGRVTFNVEVNSALFQSNVRGVTGNYFAELGATPLMGRFIDGEDDDRRARVAVISYEFWNRYFGHDSAVLTRTLRVEGQLFTIVGVTRKWFTGITPGEPPEIMVPLTASPFDVENRSLLWLFAMGRLNPGVSLEAARAQLQPVWPGVLEASVPTEGTGQRRQAFLSMGLRLQSAARGISTDLRSRFREPLYLLMGIVAMVLLITCANLANFMLARAAGRQHEMVIRTALGASRMHIARQVITESILLSVPGALLALGVAYAGVPLLVRLMAHPSATPIIVDYRPDWRVFAFTAAVCAITALLMALAPAWHLTRVDPASVQRQQERGFTGGKASGLMSRGLLVAQIALSVVLVLGAGLLVRTLQRLLAGDAGFNKSGVLEVGLYKRPEGYKNINMDSYRKQSIEEVEHLPGVVAAGFSSLPVPAGDNGWEQMVAPSGTEAAATGNGVPAILAMVSPGFFRTLQLPLLSGRDFEWSDTEEQGRVAVIDRNLARRLYSSGGAVGQRVRFGLRPEFQDLEVVGVVSSARIIDLRNPDVPVLYVPVLQHQAFSQFAGQGNLFVRGAEIQGLARGVEKTVASFGHEYTGSGKSVTEMYDDALVEERAAAILATFFAGLALLTAGIGVFGLMSYSVTRRTREIGVRVALGSPTAKVFRMVLAESLLLLVAGLAVGVPCALAAVRLIMHMLYVPPADPLTLAAVAALFIAVGVLAGYLPARRATHLEPMAALRHE